VEYVFIGGTPRGYQLLKALINKGYIPDFAVVLKEDPHESQTASTELIKLLTEHNIGYSLKKKLGVEEIDIIAKKKRDLAVVCGWRTLIDTSLDQYFKHGFLAAHDSLLPKYRGFAPINWAMICGERQTGVTLFRITEGETDSGPVYDQKIVSIDDVDYAEDVYRKIITATTDLYLNLFHDLENGNIVFRTQNESEATYTCKRTPADGRIDWSLASGQVLNFIRAIAPPYPGAFCYFQGEKFIVHRAEKGENDGKKYVQNIAGRVINIRNGCVEVMCGSGSIMISEWSKESVVSKPAETIKSISLSLE
jgi:methionyl-tRNA formyltransferase